MELLRRHYKDNAKIAHAVSGAVTNMSQNPMALSKFVSLGCIALLSLVMNYYANKGDTDDTEVYDRTKNLFLILAVS